MADPPSVTPLLSSINGASTPPHSTPSGVSFLSSTPTASLRSSSTTTKRVSTVSLDFTFDLGTEGPHTRDERIEQWLEQQCGGSLALESVTAAHSTEGVFQPALRPVVSSTTRLTGNSTATPVTSASFSWEDDPLLPISASPTTPSSPAIPRPHLSDPSTHPSSISGSKTPVTHEHLETEAARADSPLLGFPDLAVTDHTASTCLLRRNHGADVDKPLPLPPLPSTVLTSGIAEAATQCPIEVAPLAKPRSPCVSNPSRGRKHSPTSSYSSSSSSRQSHPRNHHHSVSNQSLDPSRVHVPRAQSGSSFSGGVRTLPSIQPLSTLRWDIQDTCLQTATHCGPSSSTRTRSHSNAVPTSIKQFHLPTGMIHRSHSHAQLRNGAPVPSLISSIHDLQASNQSSHTSMVSTSISSSGGALIQRSARRPSKVSPPISRTHSSYALVSQSHARQTSEILDKLESRVPSLSSSFSRHAVYIDSDDISARLDQLLLLAKEEIEGRVVEEDEDEEEDVEEGLVVGEQWVDMVKGHACGEGSINQQIASPPNSPAIGFFGSALSVTASAISGSGGGLTRGGFYGSPEASSQVYLGSNPISENHSIEQLGKNLIINQEVDAHLHPVRPPPAPLLDSKPTNGESRPIVDFVPQECLAGALHGSLPMHSPTPTPPEQIEDEETMEEALAVARELAGEDRMIWGVRGSLEVFDDCWSEFEDEEMGVGVCTLGGLPSTRVGPYGSLGEADTAAQQSHIRFDEGHGMRDGGLAPPSLSKWSLTSSIDEERRTAVEDKPKKEKKRRSFVPFIISGDKDRDKESKDDGSIHKENGTIGKKRSRLASFISRLSSVGLGGSGSNTPSLRTPPMPMLSASNSAHALPALFSVPPSKWDSPSLPALTPNFSATPSRSSSPTVPPDPPKLHQQLQVTIVADDDHSSSPSSSRLAVTSFNSTVSDVANLSPPNRPVILPPRTISIPLTTSRRPIPPGIVIPPLPTRPPPELPVVAFPLGKAASEGMINADSHVSEPSPMVFKPRSNSTADSFPKHVTFSRSLPIPSFSRTEQVTLSSTLRRSVLTKSASASVLGLHQLKPISPFVLADTTMGLCYDDGLIPPTPTSMASTEDYGETQRRDDDDDRPKRLRLRAMSSLGALPLSKSKGGLKAFVERLTGRGKSSAKASPAQLHVSLGSDSNHRTTEDPEQPDPIAIVSRKTPTPKHSPSGSFSASGAGGGSGVLSGLISYLDRASFRT